MKVLQVLLLSFGALALTKESYLQNDLSLFDPLDQDVAFDELGLEAFDDELAQEFEAPSDSERIPQAAKISVQEFHSDKAIEINRPSAAFAALVKKESPLSVQAYQEDDDEMYGSDEEFDDDTPEGFDDGPEMDSEFEAEPEETFDAPDQEYGDEAFEHDEEAFEDGSEASYAESDSEDKAFDEPGQETFVDPESPADDAEFDDIVSDESFADQ
ncbi:hypothetical protein HDU91_002810, partial [Kappamyces sp. JEL0680]